MSDLQTLAKDTADLIAQVAPTDAEMQQLVLYDALRIAQRLAVDAERKRHGEYMDHVTRKRRRAEADLSIAVTALAVHHPGEELTITKEQNRTLPLDRTLFARYDDDGNMYVAIHYGHERIHPMSESLEQLARETATQYLSTAKHGGAPLYDIILSALRRAVEEERRACLHDLHAVEVPTWATANAQNAAIHTRAQCLRAIRSRSKESHHVNQ